MCSDIDRKGTEYFVHHFKSVMIPQCKNIICMINIPESDGVITNYKISRYCTRVLLYYFHRNFFKSFMH